jgi:hypothetical protein
MAVSTVASVEGGGQNFRLFEFSTSRWPIFVEACLCAHHNIIDVEIQAP